MSKRGINIVILESSEIIYQGILNILTRTGQPLIIQKAEDINELQQINLRKQIEIIIINPVLIQNQIKLFNGIKKELINTKWIGFIYSFVDPELVSIFDGIININDSPKTIINTIQKQTQQSRHKDHDKEEINLSDRETEVLKLLVAGNANKDIADNLNISTSTVITHRKNISQKTGIKSVSGLTIYAVTKHIITIENFDM